MHRNDAQTKLRRVLGILLAILATACIPSTPYTSLTRLSPTPYPPRPADYPIRFFQATAPRCAFQEIATVKATRSLFWQKREQVPEALRAKARESGGDAIIGFREDLVVTGASESAGGGVDLDRAYVPSGTVIRYSDPKCME